MKKIHYLLLLVVLLLSATAKAQTAWVSKNLDEKISVKFPVEPEKTTKNAVSVYMLKEKDSVAYSAGVIDLKVLANLDSAALAPMKDNQKFADQLKMGMASQKANYNFGDITMGKWKGFTTYSMTATENKTKDMFSVQMILIGSKMYSFSCRVPANYATKKNELFFSSIAMLK